jgi:hypothetical protein
MMQQSQQHNLTAVNSNDSTIAHCGGFDQRTFDAAAAEYSRCTDSA